MISLKMKKKIVRALLYLPISMIMRVKLLRYAGYKIGKDSMIGKNFIITDMSSDKDNIVIGDRVNIGSNVSLITTSGPNTSILSRIYSLKFGKIVIEDDCWIGTGVIILPGITIGKCSIIGAGVVVDKDIPAYTAVKHSNYDSIKFNDSLVKKLNMD